MDADRVIATLAQDQHGIVARRDLRAAGLTVDQIAARVRRRVLRRLHDGVYLHAAWPLTRTGRLLAALLAAGDDATLSHRTAARFEGMAFVPAALPELVVPGAVRRRRPGLIIHRAEALDPVDVVVRDGLRLTTPARTLLDLGAVLPEEVVRRVAEDSVVRGLTGIVDLVCLLERLGKRGRRGTVTLRQVVLSAQRLDKLESRLELALFKLIVDVIGEAPALQYEVVLPNGRVVRFDFAWPRLLLAVEADGRRWHSTSAAFARDLERSNAIAAAGWAHYRYGWDAVHQGAKVVRAQLLAAYTAAVAAAA